MMYDLDTEECNKLGVTFPSSRMPNGEYRFRCFDENGGFGYALTKMPDNASGWQNSHYHKSVIETYIVQSGWIGFACLEADVLELRTIKAGEMITTKLRQPHNVFMSAGSVIHTVKHGDCSTKNDWFESVELDSITKHLSQADIARLSS